MIKNKKQHTAFVKRLQELQTEIQEIIEVLKDDKENIQLKLQLNTFERGLSKMKAEMKEYENLTSNQLPLLEFDSFKDNMNKSIMSFRIASGMSQKQLADEMFIKEQQIQRYEQTDYLSASFDRILQLLNVLGVQMILKKKFDKTDLHFLNAENIKISNTIKARKQTLQIV